MRTSVTIGGVIILIIGIIIAAIGATNTSLLYSGTAILIIGILVAGAGAATGRREEEIPAQVSRTIQHGTERSGMAMPGQGGMAMEGSMDDMVRMLANAPEAERKSMVRSRLQMFLGMPENQRQMAIKGMITSLHKLPPDQKRRMLKTRTEVIGELSEDQRRTIMKSRMMGMNDNQDINMADMQATEQVMAEVPDGPRMAFMRTMKELKESMPMM